MRACTVCVRACVRAQLLPEQLEAEPPSGRPLLERSLEQARLRGGFDYDNRAGFDEGQGRKRLTLVEVRARAYMGGWVGAWYGGASSA